MWSDSETATDFLGFDLLIDTVQILVSDASLRPVTIGIDGTWGSGKSSLMKMVAAAVDERADDAGSQDEALVAVHFSPWMYEDYDDIKYALIDKILDAVATHSTDADASGKVSRARRLAKKLMSFRGATSKIAGIGAGSVAALAGTPEASLAAAAVAQAVTDDALGRLSEQPDIDEESDVANVAGLRDLLAGLLSGLPSNRQLVMLVDDVDRCLPDTVVRTFEVMRLFSDIPEVTFVLAADRGIVEDAITARYRTIGFTDEGREIGHDYLEKMWNVTVKIPPLSGAEVETYLTLLACERHHPEATGALAARARARRQGFETLRPQDISDLIDDLSADFQNDWKWITATADVIATMDKSHPGNPRQVKRFANRLSLGTQLLKKNGVDEVDAGVLVKLMLLEEQDPAGFNSLMQDAIAAADGAPTSLRAWEQPHGADVEDQAEHDAGDPTDLDKQSKFFREWLSFEPPLANVDLRPYLYVARDQSPVARDARNLSAGADAVLQNLQARAGTSELIGAVRGFADLGVGDKALIVSILKRATARRPAAATTDALLVLAKNHDSHVVDVIEALKAVPPASVTPALVAKTSAALEGHPSSLLPLIEHWAEVANSQFARNAASSTAKTLRGE